MKLLKVFRKGLVSPFRQMKYKKGKTYVCKDFCDDKKADCASGFFATDWDGLSYAFRKGLSVYVVEVSGKKVEYDQFKRRYEKIKILTKLPIKEIKAGLKQNSDKAGYDLYKASFPHNPLSKMTIPTEQDIDNLKKWASVWASVRNSGWDSVWVSVRDSVWNSVGDSVRDSVWNSVGDSVRDSVWDSVWNSVGDSVWASVRNSVEGYISSIFHKKNEWQHIDHQKGVNPFQSCIDLWNKNLVPSYDGEIWRLHSGKDAKIVYEYKIKE